MTWNSFLGFGGLGDFDVLIRLSGSGESGFGESGGSDGCSCENGLFFKGNEIFGIGGSSSEFNNSQQ